jgi:hypothetical protein
MVSTMFVQFNRTAIATVWFVSFGLLALLWSPPSVAMGVFLFLVALGCPAAMVFLWNEPSQVAAPAVPRVEGSRPAR